MAGATNRAIVFCGQGSHRLGMGLKYIGGAGSRSAQAWNIMTDTMSEKYRWNLSTVLHDNPPFLDVADTAWETARNHETLLPRGASGAASPPPLKSTRWRHPSGVMQLTYVAQPAMLAAQMVMWNHLQECSPKEVGNVCCFAGHSLGEFSALTAANVFPVDVAVDLVFRRGVFMSDALLATAPIRQKGGFMMYAANPTRARLHDFVALAAPETATTTGAPTGSTADPVRASDVFAVLIELVAHALRHTTSFVELVNANVQEEQYVVAGDEFALAALGKLLDPQFRANVDGAGGIALTELVALAVESVAADKVEGIEEMRKAARSATADFVPGSKKRYGRSAIGHRFLRGPDDGHTLSIEELSSLTLQDDGRSGLKRKSWYVPLAVETPFHCSLLRRAVDDLYPLLLAALPSDDVLRKGIVDLGEVGGEGKPKWICNLTGSPFSMGPEFRRNCAEAMSSLNVGEVVHHGKMGTACLDSLLKTVMHSTSPCELLAATLAAQVAHPVQWIDTMECMVSQLGVTDVVEIAPVKTLTEMFRRTVFPKEVRAECLPN